MTPLAMKMAATFEYGPTFPTFVWDASRLYLNMVVLWPKICGNSTVDSRSDTVDGGASHEACVSTLQLAVFNAVCGLA